jgi:hypothetical protein
LASLNVYHVHALSEEATRGKQITWDWSHILPPLGAWNPSLLEEQQVLLTMEPFLWLLCSFFFFFFFKDTFTCPTSKIQITQCIFLKHFTSVHKLLSLHKVKFDFGILLGIVYLPKIKMWLKIRSHYWLLWFVNLGSFL